MKWILAVMLTVGTAAAQDAKVIALSPADAAEAKRLYAQQKDIQDRIDALQKRIVADYLSTDKKLGRIAAFTSIKDGWGIGNFKFSEDFKYIVPLIPKFYSANTYCNGMVVQAPDCCNLTYMTHQ